MQRNKYQCDLYNFLKHKCPPIAPPAMHPQLSCAIDRKYFHRRNTHMLFYLWLNSCQEFWFFPIAFTPAYVRGYIWHGEKWIGGYIEKEMIYAFF